MAATLLPILAARVRRARGARGWSRAELAERSGLSLRFLARIEGGGANLSIARLADLAAALGTTPELLPRAPRPRSPVVALVGMRGAGKSTVGPILARSLRVPFVEMDARIQRAAGLPLDQIFELHGERYYRRLERETLSAILSEPNAAVVAAAGGVVNEPATWKLLLERTTVVWMRAAAEDHWRRVVAQGDRRPMADNPDAMAELRTMLSARESRYAQAQIAVDTRRRSPRSVASEIKRSLAELDAGAV